MQSIKNIHCIRNVENENLNKRRNGEFYCNLIINLTNINELWLYETLREVMVDCLRVLAEPLQSIWDKRRKG